MNDKRNNEIVLVVTILGAFVCLLMANGVLERMVERPFLNHVNFRNEKFNSPPNIIFLTSAIILCLGLLAKCLKNSKNSSDHQQQNTNQSQYQDQQTENKNQNQQTQIFGQKLELMYHLKTSLPKFVETTCFLYGISCLGFPEMMFLSVLIKLVFGLIYESKFTDRQNRCLKIVLSVLACFAYGCFNTFEASPKSASSQRQIIYGSLFAFIIFISSITRKLLNHNNNHLHLQPNTISIIDTIMYQSKISLILSFLLSFSLNQQIYGPVFAILHYQFMIDIFMLGGLLFIGTLLKTFCRRQFSCYLTEFMVALQKCIIVFVVLTYSSSQVSIIITLAITLLALVAFVNFYLQLNSTNSMAKVKSISQGEKVSIMEQKIENVGINVDYGRNQLNYAQ